MAKASGDCVRDLLVIGGSAGAVEAMRRLVAGLPGDLPASVLVAIHRSHEGPGYLAEVLSESGPLPALNATEGMRITHGRIYVAPPDHHLLVGQDHVHVRRGPKENRSRPAIDPLFRSAAVTCTTRVIGLILSGKLDDGTAGLLAIRRCGGIGVAQDPDDAEHGQMPRSAIANRAVAHVRTLRELPALLARLVGEPCPPPVEPADELRMESLIAAQELHMDPDQQVRLGHLAPLSCPDCHGSLYEIDDSGFRRFRCHTGHAFTASTLGSAQEEAWERALYQALATQEEQLALLHRMASDARARGLAGNAKQLAVRAIGYEEGAEIIRGLLRANGSGLVEASGDVES